MFTSLRGPVPLAFDPDSGCILVWLDIVGRSRQWAESFVSFCGLLEYVHLRPTGFDPVNAVPNILFFLLHTVEPGYWRLTCPESAHLIVISWLVKILGVGLELFVYHVHVPSAPIEVATNQSSALGIGSMEPHFKKMMCLSLSFIFPQSRQKSAVRTWHRVKGCELMGLGVKSLPC